jgi:hypothetical protein
MLCESYNNIQEIYVNSDKDSTLKRERNDQMDVDSEAIKCSICQHNEGEITTCQRCHLSFHKVHMS